MSSHRTHFSRFLFSLVEKAGTLVLFVALIFHVLQYNLLPLATLSFPILALFFGFTALLYNRARALSKGRSQTRALYAAERAMQGTIWFLFGLVLGITFAGLLWQAGFTYSSSRPSLNYLFLLLFCIPIFLMLVGYLYFMRAMWIISPEFFRVVRMRQLVKRIKE